MRALLLMCLLAAMACSNDRPQQTTDAQPPHTAAPSPDSGPKAPEPPVCTPQCTAPDTVQLCKDGAHTPPAACPQDTACLAGACAPLALPGTDKTLPLAALRPVGPEGWINAWALSVNDEPDPIDRAFAKAQPTDSLSWRSVCAPSAFVRARPWVKVVPKDPESALLVTHVVSDRDRPALLKIGTMGDAAIALNGKPIANAWSDGYGQPFPDEHLHRVDLKAGPNTLAVRLRRTSKAALGTLVRFSDTDHAPLPGLAVATPAAASPCALAALTRVQHTVRPTKDGAEIELTLSLPGTAPAEGQITWVAKQSKPKRKARKEIGRGTLPVDALRAGATVRVPTTASEPGNYGLEFFLDGKSRLEAKVGLRPRFNRRVLALKDAPPKPPKDANIQQSALDSYAVLVEGLETRVITRTRDERGLNRQITQAETIAKALSEGEDPYPTLTGTIIRAYRSPVDGRLQRYAAYVPPSYMRYKEDDFALIVAAHGLGSKPEQALTVTMGGQPRDRRAIIVAPWGFQNSGQRLLGEHDVLEVVREMRAAYRINPQRVSVTGASLGGTVSLVVPLHYPGLFSATASLCGYPNIETYSQVEGKPRSPWEEVLIARKAIRNYAENGLHLRIRLIHGQKDAPERVSGVSKRLRRLGIWHKFDIQKDMGHNVWDYAYEDGDMLNWLRWRTVPEAPRRDRLKTGEYRYDRSIWLRIWAMEEQERFAEIDAQWDEDRARLEIKTKNTSAFEVDLSRQTLAEAAVAVVDGGSAMSLNAGLPKAIFIKEDGAWSLSETAPERGGLKRKGVQGPLDDVQTHPQMIVYGTQIASETASNKLVATHFQVQDRRTEIKIPIRSDTEITEEEIKSHSLVLIGRPETNALTARLEKVFLATFEADALTLGGKRFEGKDVGISMIRPHPTNPNEYVVLHAGIGVEGTLASRHLPELVPDFVVYDRTIKAQRWAMLMDRRKTLWGGFFAQDWSLP